jgi:hypothetical protein
MWVRTLTGTDVVGVGDNWGEAGGCVMGDGIRVSTVSFVRTTFAGCVGFGVHRRRCRCCRDDS